MSSAAGPAMDPATAVERLTSWGFLARSSVSDRGGPAYLLVALRAEPTLRHFDPETIEYWAVEHDRGVRRRITREDHLPLTGSFSWGMIRIIDRLAVSNEYLTFGGDLFVVRVEDAAIAIFTSPAPLLRRGGHSQPWDPGADSLGAYFGRFLLAVDYAPGFEAQAAAASPLARYAAFLSDELGRYRGLALRVSEPRLWLHLQAEQRRMRACHPVDWALGQALLEATRQPGRPVSG